MAGYSCDEEDQTRPDDEAGPTLAHDAHGGRPIGLIPEGGPVWGPPYILTHV